jgi:general secretion pathway protein G
MHSLLPFLPLKKLHYSHVPAVKARCQTNCETRQTLQEPQPLLQSPKATGQLAPEEFYFACLYQIKLDPLRQIDHTVDMANKLLPGFTLVELLVVISILAILSTIGIGNFQSARIKARDLSRKSDLQTIAKSLEAYVNDHRTYPLSQDGKIICQSTPTTICDWGEPFTDGSTTYITTLPQDSVGAAKYVYVAGAGGGSYNLYTHLENEQDPLITTFDPVVECGSSTWLCNYKVSSSNVQ